MNESPQTEQHKQWTLNMGSIFINQHKIFKRTWKGRILDALTSDLTRKMLKFAGVYMIFFTFICHFDIKFNVWESLVLGVGLGLAID